MSFVKEFKDFAMRGNVIDLAIGVIMGGAFGKITASLVSDIFMPILSLFTKGVDFNQLYISLDGKTYETLAAAQEAGAAIIKYGAFIQAVIDFVIIAFVVFLFIKAMNKLKRKEEEQATEAAPAAPPAPTKEELILTEIRDLLKNSAK
jgi:large conductance mechanosensitive channel